MKPPPPPFHDESKLLSRLAAGVRRGERRVVFVLGAALTSPEKPDEPGVPGVAGMIELIKEQLRGQPRNLAALQRELTQSHNPYQTAFTVLQGCGGPDDVRGIIRQAVLQARWRRDPPAADLGEREETSLAACEEDITGWHLSAGLRALGQLIFAFPQHFGTRVLTTNFDPLIEIAINRAGGQWRQTILLLDGDFMQSRGPGCQVVHLHGYWWGDTLHTPSQLLQHRPILRESLRRLLQDCTVVVMAFGGWDDTFTNAVREVAQVSDAELEVLWTFYDEEPERLSHAYSELLATLEPGITTGRVTLYRGIDVHFSLPKLWEEVQSLAPHPSPEPPRPERKWFPRALAFLHEAIRLKPNNGRRRWIIFFLICAPTLVVLVVVGAVVLLRKSTEFPVSVESCLYLNPPSDELCENEKGQIVVPLIADDLHALQDLVGNALLSKQLPRGYSCRWSASNTDLEVVNYHMNCGFRLRGLDGNVRRIHLRLDINHQKENFDVQQEDFIVMIQQVNTESRGPQR